MAFLRDSSRTEKASPKKKKEAREKGQIARSQNLPFTVSFLGIILLLGSYGPFLFDTLKSLMQYQLSHIHRTDFTIGDLQSMWLGISLQIGKVVMLIMMTALALSVAANAAQGGLVISAHKLGFHFGGLNPLQGIQRLLPKTSVIELLKNLLTIGLVTHFATSVYSSIQSDLPRYLLLTPLQIGGRISLILYHLAIKCGTYLLFVAVIDYFWNRHQFEQNLKMTKEEVKDEGKNAEGNPEIKGRIKRKQREIAMKFIMAAIPKADVVITNPTHFAVALAYSKDKMNAPTVVAKGQDYLALRIREVAKEHQVPLMENKPLAQTLYKTVEVGQQIPGTLYKAVAEVLAYVYKLKTMRL
jgi:flagellar biosynthesis protein FlhB